MSERQISLPTIDNVAHEHPVYHTQEPSTYRLCTQDA